MLSTKSFFLLFRIAHAKYSIVQTWAYENFGRITSRELSFGYYWLGP